MTQYEITELQIIEQLTYRVGELELENVKLRLVLTEAIKQIPVPPPPEGSFSFTSDTDTVESNGSPL